MSLPEFVPAAVLKLKFHEHAIRFVFGGVVSVLASLVAREYGASLGGVFLAFPAILPASLTLVKGGFRHSSAAADDMRPTRHVRGPADACRPTLTTRRSRSRRVPPIPTPLPSSPAASRCARRRNECVPRRARCAASTTSSAPA